MFAYDLDGVLAAKPPMSPKPWMRMTGPERKERNDFLVRWYRTTAQLLTPPDDLRYIVITARKLTPNVVEATEAWFQDTFVGPKPLTVQYLSLGRSLDNVVEFKIRSILQMGVSQFVEDNRNVLRRMAADPRMDGVHLLYWQDGMEEMVPWSEIIRHPSVSGGNRSSQAPS